MRDKKPKISKPVTKPLAMEVTRPLQLLQMDTLKWNGTPIGVTVDHFTGMTWIQVLVVVKFPLNCM